MESQPTALTKRQQPNHDDGNAALYARHKSPDSLDMQCHLWQPFLCLLMLPAVQCHLQLLYLLVLTFFEVLLSRVLPAGKVETS